MKALLFLLFLLGAIDQPEKNPPAIPILCFHNISADKDKKNTILFISNGQFLRQVQSLYDSGYHSVTPDQLHAYLTMGMPLPSKPFMITFDDSHREHFTIAAPILQQYGFKGVFFVMTVTIGKPGYLTAAQIKTLSDQGHIIGLHTWDHPHLKSTGKIDIDKQLITPRKTLEKITGGQVSYFAYPFGEWNEWLAERLKTYGFKAAFQLTGKREEQVGLYNIKRFMVAGSWSGPMLQQEMRTVFSKDNH
jgi:Predicted xylanase/chitin deacetylase